MIVYVTSIGEATTDLCLWSLKRNGFETVLIKDRSTLAQKLNHIYYSTDEDFLRVDADVVVNRNCTPDNIKAPENIWWVQYVTFDWYKQDIGHGGVQFIKKECLPALRANIGNNLSAERPESQMYRLAEFNDPRRCITEPTIMGLHNYAQRDVRRVIDTKRRRNQYDEYDWELARKLNAVT